MFVSFEICFRKLSAEEQDILKGAIPKMTFSEDGFPSFWGKEILTLDDAVPLLRKELIKVTDVHRTSERIPTLAQNPTTQIINIVAKSLPVTSVNRVKVLEDCCTDTLQEHLDKDWRIVAVCPQEGRRRPDYVIGRVGGSEAEEEYDQ